MEQSLKEFADRVQIREIYDFVEVISAVKKTGGNAIKIIKETVNRIVESIELGAELEVMIAAKKLEEVGIPTNVTLVFSPSQAIQAARLGAKFVSPFIGWKENSGDDGQTYVKDIADIYAIYGYETEIIAAACRNGRQISEMATAGVDVVTAGLQVYRDSFYHPFTDYGLKKFQNAWDETLGN